MEESLVDVGNWQLVDCEANILTKMVKYYGGDKIQVEELWNMNLSQLKELSPLHGFMVLYKWEPPKLIERNLCFADEDKSKNIFFAKQVINEGCITQAMVNILLNCHHPDIELSQTLLNYHKICSHLSPTLKGLALANNSGLRIVHNSLSKCYLNFITTDVSDRNSVYHYVTYMPIDDVLYEMDGLKDSPIVRGRIAPDSDWIEMVKPLIERRVHLYQEYEIPFNVCAIATDKKMKYITRVSEIDVLLNNDPNCAADYIDDLESIYMQIEEETNRRERSKIETLRRKHDYTPFLTEMLKMVICGQKTTPPPRKSEHTSRSFLLPSTSKQF